MITNKLRRLANKINVNECMTALIMISYIIMGISTIVYSYDKYFEKYTKSECMTMTADYCLDVVNYRGGIRIYSIGSASISGIFWPVYYIILL